MSHQTVMLIEAEVKTLKELGIKSESFDHPNESYYSIATYHPKGEYPGEKSAEEVLEILRENRIRVVGFGPGLVEDG